ncbi:MAG: hypothetical protein RLP44_17055 [Aggregatilineales bacterium]
MTLYALGMLLMLAFMVLMIVAAVVILMMESIELEDSFIQETLRDTTTLSLAPVIMPTSESETL